MTTEPEDVQNGDYSRDSPDFSLSDFFVAPWGLANEKRPIHLLWEGKVESVSIRIPDPMELEEVNNLDGSIEKAEYSNKEFSEIHISSEDLSSQGYLAGELIVPKVFDDSMVGQEIKVFFDLLGDKTVEKARHTFTIRPKIELVDAPDQVVLDSSNQKAVIDIDMRYVGFGMAEVEIEVQGDGEVISEAEDLLVKVAENFYESGITEKESLKTEDLPKGWKDKPEYEISKENLQIIAEDMRKVLLEGKEVFDDFDVDEMLQIAKALEEGDTDKEWDISSMYEFLELALVNSILDIVDRHPTEGVRVENPNREFETDENTTEISVIYRLSDRENNDYQSVRHDVNIIDRRETNDMVGIEINTNWESHQIDPDQMLQKIMEEL